MKLYKHLILNTLIIIRMEQVMPIETVKNNFKTKVIKLTLIHKRQFVSYFEALTSFGNMTLILQQLFTPSSQNSHKVNSQEASNFIEERNRLLQCSKIASQLIYEQQIIKIRENYSICTTLTQPILIKKRQNIATIRSSHLFEDLVDCAFKISQSPFSYPSQCYMFQDVIFSQYTELAYLDFTRIIKVKGQNEFTSDLSLFKRQICNLIEQSNSLRQEYIIQIKQKSMIFNPQVIQDAVSWVDLAFMFNLLQNQKVTVVTQKKVKVQLVSKLNGCITFDYKGSRYQKINFQEGFRTDAFKEVGYQALNQFYGEQRVVYSMSKKRYQTIRKKIDSDQLLIKQSVDFNDLICIEKQISKSQFISFLIGYFKLIEPALRMIRYIQQFNALRIQYVNKSYRIKTILIKFSSNYVVKDEEVSMIIQKGKIKNTIINLQKMKITDSFLMFLANCDKMLQIVNLNISYCSFLTDSGLQSLFASPLCKNITSLKISGLPLIDFSFIKFKKELKELQINNCTLAEEELNVSDWKLQRLEAIGVNIKLYLPQSLWVLRLTVDVPLDSLKMLKNLSLTQLKVKIVDTRKQIKSILNHIKAKQNPAKIFAQGRLKNTLRQLDISGSNAKLKELKFIFCIQTLQTLVCEDMERDRFGDVTLPSHIVSLSFQNSRLNADLLTQLLSKTSLIVKLNIFKTDVEDLLVESFVRTKKLINLLEIDEQQLNSIILSKKSPVECFYIHLDKYVHHQKEFMFNKLLLNQVQSKKQVNFICSPTSETQVIQSLHRFTLFYQEHLSKRINNSLNVFVNSVALWKYITHPKTKSEAELIIAFDAQNLQHSVKIHPQMLVSQKYMLGSGLHLQSFTVYLFRTMRICPNHLLQISIKGNRVLSSEVVEVIRKYAGHVLRAIDFRYCIFSYDDVKRQLYECSVLQEINKGEYEIVLKEEDNCEVDMQKILKLFMRLRSKEKMKLKVKVNEISQKELFYSILCQIINLHTQSIQHLQLYFKNMPGEGSAHFWNEIFLLKRLNSLSITYHSDFTTDKDIDQLSHCFRKLNDIPLYELRISLTIPQILPQHLGINQLKVFSFDACGQQVSETSIMKLIKNILNIERLDLKLANDESLSSTKKIIDIIQKMPNLSFLSIDLQNCPLKQSHIFDIFTSLYKSRHELTLLGIQKVKNLQKLQLNANNISMNMSELVKHCEQLQKHHKNCSVQVYALQSKSQAIRDEEDLLEKGIEIIHNIKYLEY